MDDLSETTEEKTRILILGNKTDLEAQREVSFQEACDLASTYGVDYMECSAKTG
jgi:GTPase SAR1 family protein